MSTRSNKRRVSKLFHDRFHRPVPWRSVEEQAWLEIVPVGRELGSRDYHRFEQLEGFAFDAFEDMALAQQWLSQPHPALGGMTPNECARSDLDLQKALDLMAELKHGANTGSSTKPTDKR